MVAAGVAVLVAGPPGTGAALEHQTDPAWARPATTVTSWSTREQWPTTAPRADAVTIAPAYGRSIHLQEYVDGRWQTRTTTRLDDVASQRLEVALPRQWTERPVSRWRLQLPATDEALAHTTPVKRVEARWEPSADPASLTALVTKADGVSPRTWAPRRLVRPDIATLGHNDRLRPLAAVALERLAAGARRATGRELVLASGYRSYAYQASLYHRYVGSDGAAAASFAARAGHSEHQLGLAADVAQAGSPFTRFGETRSGRWVARHAWRYGYVVRYPSGEQDRTGYEPEPWHLRYVGSSLAAYLHHAGISTLEEAFSTPPR